MLSVFLFYSRRCVGFARLCITVTMYGVSYFSHLWRALGSCLSPNTQPGLVRLERAVSGGVVAGRYTPRGDVTRTRYIPGIYLPGWCHFS